MTTLADAKIPGRANGVTPDNQGLQWRATVGYNARGIIRLGKGDWIFATFSAVNLTDPPDSALACNVLVLNRHYMAIRVINVRRAFSLLVRELAEVVHIEDGQYLSYDFDTWRDVSESKHKFQPAEHDWIRTVRFEIAVPRIIRLMLYDRLPRQDVKFNRRNIYARDGNRCQYCGKRFATNQLSIDHVVPRSQGGKTTWENVVCACLNCNVRKGGRTPEQADMKLTTTPRKPRRSPVINVKLSHNKYRCWQQFLDHAYWSVELK